MKRSDAPDLVRLSHLGRRDAPRYPGNPPDAAEAAHSFGRGDDCETFVVTLFNHNGTHIDFPAHNHPQGRRLQDYDVDDFVFTSPRLVDLGDVGARAIEPEDLAAHGDAIAAADALLIRTGWSRRRGREEWPRGPFLSARSAHWVRRTSTARCIVLDTVSITNVDHREVGKEVHRILLDAASGPPPFVVEDADLEPLSSQRSIARLYAVPLFFEGVDGMPCTVFAELA